MSDFQESLREAGFNEEQVGNVTRWTKLTGYDDGSYFHVSGSISSLPVTPDEDVRVGISYPEPGEDKSYAFLKPGWTIEQVLEEIESQKAEFVEEKGQRARIRGGDIPQFRIDKLMTGLGYEVWDTGGGLTAWGKFLGGDTEPHILVCDTEQSHEMETGNGLMFGLLEEGEDGISEERRMVMLRDGWGIEDLEAVARRLERRWHNKYAPTPSSSPAP